jgi:transposase
MSRKINLIPQDTVEDWHRKIELIKDNGHKLKMLVIEKILSNPNVSRDEVVKTFFISKETMGKWIKQYNNDGLEGLKAKNPKGRGSGKGNKKYNDEVYVRLKEEMGKSDNKWTLKEMQFYLSEEFGIKPTLPTISKGIERV